MHEFDKTSLVECGVKVYDKEFLTENGIALMVKEIVDYFTPDGVEHPIHISFDADAIDPSVTPHIAPNRRKGFSEKEAHELIRKIVRTGCVTSMDLIQNKLNPENKKLIQGSDVIRMGMDLLASGLGNNPTGLQRGLSSFSALTPLSKRIQRSPSEFNGLASLITDSGTPKKRENGLMKKNYTALNLVDLAEESAKSA